MLGQYDESIIWADKSLKINPKHCDSLLQKGVHYDIIQVFRLSSLKKFKEALVVLDQLLCINSNHFDSLWSKGDDILYLLGKCLKFVEMINIYYKTRNCFLVL